MTTHNDRDCCVLPNIFQVRRTDAINAATDADIHNTQPQNAFTSPNGINKGNDHGGVRTTKGRSAA
jgi:hypothetical protein